MIRGGKDLDLENFHGSLRHGIDSAPQPFAILLPSSFAIAARPLWNLSHRPLTAALSPVLAPRPGIVPNLNGYHLRKERKQR